MFETTYPKESMYGIFMYIWLIFMVNVGKYTVHGWYGYCRNSFNEMPFRKTGSPGSPRLLEAAIAKNTGNGLQQKSPAKKKTNHTKKEIHGNIQSMGKIWG